MTETDKKVLSAYRALGADGVSPSYDQVAKLIGYASKSAIKRAVDRLIDEGKLRRLPGRARRVVIMPDLQAAIRELFAAHGYINVTNAALDARAAIWAEEGRTEH